jgi:hypothetical protein
LKLPGAVRVFILVNVALRERINIHLTRCIGLKNINQLGTAARGAPQLIVGPSTKNHMLGDLVKVS